MPWNLRLSAGKYLFGRVVTAWNVTPEELECPPSAGLRPPPLFFILMLAPVLAGCGGKPDTTPTSTSHAQPGPANTTQLPPRTDTAEDLTKAKPDVVMEAEKLTEEFREHNTESLNKYRGKVLEVSGKVMDYTYTSRGDVGRLVIGPGINTYECADPHPMAKAMPGQKVTLRGKCEPGLGVKGWTIVAVEGESPPTISAEQLAKEYKADEDGTAKKYRGKFLIVTGNIQELKKEIGTKVLLTKPGEKPKVTCFFGDDAQDVAERHGWLKSGESVRVLGQWLSGDPELSGCVILPPAK